MSLAPRLDLRQAQALVITPQLRQAIHLLQCTNLEAAEIVAAEIERNPLLEPDERPERVTAEEAEPDRLPVGEPPDEFARETPLDVEPTESRETDGMPAEPMRASPGPEPGEALDFDTFSAPGPTLREHLGQQLRLAFADPVDRLIGAHLIALLTPAGRLDAAPEAVAAALGAEHARVEAVRARMMRFDPVGLFARDLSECLAAQLAERNRLDPAMETLLAHLDRVAERDHRSLMALCGVDAADLADMIVELRALDPKPGAAWTVADARPVIPDVFIRPAPIAPADESDPAWLVEINPDTVPRVLANQPLYARVAANATRADRAWLAERFQGAQWLVKALHQRTRTILRVAAEIARRQDGFLRHGVSHLRPLILRDVAAVLELHESTVSRVTANKYVATPRGTFEMKYFFTNGLPGANGTVHSTEAVRHRIRALIGAETADAVLSDDGIVAALRTEGVDIARRTVAKYREALGIPSSSRRKREKAVPA